MSKRWRNFVIWSKLRFADFSFIFYYIYHNVVYKVQDCNNNVPRPVRRSWLMKSDFQIIDAFHSVFTRTQTHRSVVNLGNSVFFFFSFKPYYNTIRLTHKLSLGLILVSITLLSWYITIELMASNNYSSLQEKYLFPSFPGSWQGKAKTGFFPHLLPRKIFTLLHEIFFQCPQMSQMPGFNQYFFPIL